MEAAAEVTLDVVIARLRADNKAAPLAEITIYATAFLEWREAAANIQEHGTVVAHPRTAAPIDNPYLKVRAAAERTMAGCKRVVRTNALWAEVFGGR